MLKWLYVAAGIAFAGCALWCRYLTSELDEHKAALAVIEKEAVALKGSLESMASWSKATDKVLEEHRLASQKQKAEFRKLQQQVRAAYDDKDAADWGRARVPDSLRILLGGKPGNAGH